MAETIEVQISRVHGALPHDGRDPSQIDRQNNPGSLGLGAKVSGRSVEPLEYKDECKDTLAVEEPLEIRLGYDDPLGSRVKKSISITMRTPGHDFDLVAGFLYTEGIIHGADQIDKISHCGTALNQARTQNIVVVEMKPGLKFDLSRLERHFYTSSSCGVCGKSSIEALKVQKPSESPANSSLGHSAAPDFKVSQEMIHQLPDLMRSAQRTFESTGGLHASCLFSLEPHSHQANPALKGEVSFSSMTIREDVGRHNALDKVIGAALLQKKLPFSHSLLLVSGRVSFELVQKAWMAGVPLLAAVGAPSSLAVELAKEMDLTLLGFVRDHRFNIYCGGHRILRNSGGGDCRSIAQ